MKIIFLLGLKLKMLRGFARKKPTDNVNKNDKIYKLCIFY